MIERDYQKPRLVRRAHFSPDQLTAYQTLSLRQRLALDHYIEFHSIYGAPPSTRELALMLRISRIKSTGEVTGLNASSCTGEWHLHTLARKGFLRRADQPGQRTSRNFVPLFEID